MTIMNMDLESIWKMLGWMLEASLVTLEIFFLTLLFALPLGLLVAFGRLSRYRIVSGFTRLYLLVMRGTPLMVQLLFVYFASDAIGISLGRFPAAILAFSLNYAAYFAEIYRGGIQSISQGQQEAANVLGFSKGQTFFHIILPQVVKKIIPPMGNEFMTLVKDTALAQTIGVMELFRLASTTTSNKSSILPIIVAGIFYLIMNAIVSKGFRMAERKMDYYE